MPPPYGVFVFPIPPPEMSQQSVTFPFVCVAHVKARDCHDDIEYPQRHHLAKDEAVAKHLLAQSLHADLECV